MESSNKANGSFGRLSSPTFTKPAGESGGCVQFYYHMYGADMGTLKIRVYDTETSGDGLVKEWSKSGTVIDLLYLLPICSDIRLTCGVPTDTSGHRLNGHSAELLLVS